MKSPVTGRPMPVKKLYSYLIHKGETIGFIQEYYFCGKTSSRYTDKKMDNDNLNRFTKAYQEAINQ